MPPVRIPIVRRYTYEKEREKSSHLFPSFTCDGRSTTATDAFLVLPVRKRRGRRRKTHHGPSMRPGTQVCPTLTYYKPPEQLVSVVAQAKRCDAYNSNAAISAW
ncbi:hypothetical protein EVAR_101966_1 [Eumeta japonica]|uniref:Uncharacterized protein n=1 Tax=Eumeta variegata TaxID=151549 RepID=A0A4C1TSH0_EUMVA|nr:hypothetical protein EVAR_101966_1 [Eumeta japonica]